MTFDVYGKVKRFCFPYKIRCALIQRWISGMDLTKLHLFESYFKKARLRWASQMKCGMNDSRQPDNLRMFFW